MVLGKKEASFSFITLSLLPLSPSHWLNLRVREEKKDAAWSAFQSPREQYSEGWSLDRGWDIS